LPLPGFPAIIIRGQAAAHVRFPSYHAFVKEVERIQDRFDGGIALMAGVKVIVNKWAARGLDLTTLTRLALGI
jgi:hypothetical protein